MVKGKFNDSLVKSSLCTTIDIEMLRRERMLDVDECNDLDFVLGELENGVTLLNQMSTIAKKTGTVATALTGAISGLSMSKELINILSNNRGCDYTFEDKNIGVIDEDE